MHRQASDRIGNNLEVIMEREGIVKFLISHDSQFIGVQFHPEAYLVTHLIESPPGAIHNKGVYKFFFSEILQHQMQNV
jgi:GMP synthase-like glutamine amidotransferase